MLQRHCLAGARRLPQSLVFARRRCCFSVGSVACAHHAHQVLRIMQIHWFCWRRTLYAKDGMCCEKRYGRQEGRRSLRGTCTVYKLDIHLLLVHYQLCLTSSCCSLESASLSSCGAGNDRSSHSISSRSGSESNRDQADIACDMVSAARPFETNNHSS
jgi:hypothetical protein